MKSFLKVYQIYFDESQLSQIEFTPIKNDNCTVFFENTVIKNLIESGAHLESDYFGVVSYQLRKKLDLTRKWKIDNIANTSNTEFSPKLFEDVLLKEKPDVLSFQRHARHDNITFSDRFHPNFTTHFRKIMHAIGYNWEPTVFENIVYCNFFVAKSSIYEKYVTEMLIPAMKIMETMPELMRNSGYPKSLPENLKETFGVNHYPYHAFICERMFSYFMHLNKLNCINY